MKFRIIIIIYIDMNKMGKFVANNLYDKIMNIVDSNIDANINFANIDLIKFKIYIKLLLVNIL